MIRKFLQSALCICLSPLLVAQQIVQSATSQTAPAQIHIDLTGDAHLRFLTPIPNSLAKTETGDLVQFAVGTDVISDSTVVLHAGVPVAGVVTEVKHSSRFHHRDGQMSINVTEMVSGKMTQVVVRCSNPADMYVPSASPRGSVSVGHAIASIATLGLVLLVVYGATHPDD